MLSFNGNGKLLQIPLPPIIPSYNLPTAVGGNPESVPAYGARGELYF